MVEDFSDTRTLGDVGSRFCGTCSSSLFSSLAHIPPGGVYWVCEFRAPAECKVCTERCRLSLALGRQDFKHYVCCVTDSELYQARANALRGQFCRADAMLRWVNTRLMNRDGEEVDDMRALAVAVFLPTLLYNQTTRVYRRWDVRNMCGRYAKLVVSPFRRVDNTRGETPTTRADSSGGGDPLPLIDPSLSSPPPPTDTSDAAVS